METAEHAVAAAGTVVLDRYALVEELGSGGFGVVWLAHDERLGRPVALKRVPIRSASHGAAERAEREALAAARLAHPAVVRLYEVERDADAVYLVSELVRGATLGDLLDEGALSDRDVLLIGMALCDALEHAHANGVVHRDVKPGNVLVPETHRDGAVAKLTDFGIARMTGDDALTATGDVVGTLAYMAPEQAEGRGATAASDLYSLALVLYEALAGANPVRRATPAATARQVGQPLPALRRVRRDLPRALTAAIDAAVQPEPALRGSLRDLRAALAGALPEARDDPGTVAPPADWATNLTPRRNIVARAGWSGGAGWDGEDEAEADGRGWALPAVGIPARFAHAALTGALVPLVLSLAQTKPPLTPAAAALAAAAASALLPRVGWLLAAAALTALVGRDSGADAAIVAAAAAPLPLLLLRRPAWWSSPALAVGLGWLGVAGAFPAIAGQARGLWSRAAVGAAGFWWTALAEVLLQRRLLLGPAHGLKALAGSEWLAVGAVWAVAAAVMPALVRGRSAAADLLGALAWTAATAAATSEVAHATGAASPRGLVGAAAAAALIAVLARRMTP